jgi:hypothetical protein
MKGEIIPESAVKFVRQLATPPAKVWEFLTDAAHLPQWYGEGNIEPREGGATLTLIHRPIPEAMQNQTAMGWHTYLDLVAAGLEGDFPKRADLFPKNAALYGVDMNNLKG